MSEALQSRRSFFALASATPLLAAPKLPRTGAGAHVYEVQHDWGQLPKSIAYGNTHGVCVDAQGHVYVHHTVHAASPTADSVVVFDRKGKFVRSFGAEFKGGAHGLHLRREGREEFLHFCDTRRALVVKTTLTGKEVFTLGYPKESPAYADPKTKYSPTNLAIAADGRLFVGDGYGSSYINVYDAQGKYLHSFGGKGKQAGQLDCPHGLTIDTRGHEPLLLVADRGNRRLQYFTLDGRHVRFAGEGDVKMPCHFDQRQGVLLVPDLEARVTLLDAENRLLVHLGDDPSNTWGQLRRQPRDKFIPGKFVCPHGACFDHDGNIFVVEWVEVGRVTKLRKV